MVQPLPQNMLEYDAWEVQSYTNNAISGWVTRKTKRWNDSDLPAPNYTAKNLKEKKNIWREDLSGYINITQLWSWLKKYRHKSYSISVSYSKSSYCFRFHSVKRHNREEKTITTSVSCQLLCMWSKCGILLPHFFSSNSMQIDIVKWSVKRGIFIFRKCQPQELHF